MILPCVTVTEKETIVKNSAKEIKTLLGGIANHILKIGQILLEVKALLGHGNFEQWIENEFAWTIRTAQRYMSAAKAFQGKENVAEALPARVVYLLSPAKATIIRKSVVEAVEAGRAIPVFTELENRIKQPKQNIVEVDVDDVDTETISVPAIDIAAMSETQLRELLKKITTRLDLVPQSKGKKWGHWEVQLLQEMWSNSTNEELLTAFEGRTFSSIRTKACRLKLGRRIKE